MKLATYRKSQYSDAFDAQKCGGLYILRDLFNDEITLDMLEKGGIDSDFHIAMDSAVSSFLCTGEDSYRFVLCDSDGEPKFEQDRDGLNEMWVDISPSVNILNELKIIEDLKLLNDANLSVVAISDPTSTNFNVIVKIKSNNVLIDEFKIDRHTIYAIDGPSITIGNKCFDLAFYYDCEKNKIHTDFYNVIADVGGTFTGDSKELITNTNFIFSISGNLLSSLDLMKMEIDEEIKNIEKWSGEAYCGPNVNGAGSEGDEIYQALHAIRKIIGIGVESYNREVLIATQCIMVKDNGWLYCNDNDTGCFIDNHSSTYDVCDNNYSEPKLIGNFDYEHEAEDALINYYIETYIDPKYK